MIRRMFFLLKNFIKYLRSGGVVYVNIAQINQGGILKGKKVAVTGGGSGIGYAIAKKFVSEGAEVIITGRNIDKLKKAQSKINSELCKVIEWDIADSFVAKDKIQEIVKSLGGVDIFVNNAGVYVEKELLTVEQKDWDYTFDINTKGMFFATQAIVEYYLTQNVKGKVINISSNRGVLGDVGPYGASKWSVLGLTQGMGRKLFPKGIIVNGIAPGMTATNINNIDVNNNAYCGETLNNKICLPEEIAEIALFLASDAANHIVGHTIVCDGGTSLK